MVLHNPNNWHWVNKDARSWTQDWLDSHVVGLETSQDGVEAKITKLMSMDGDVDVNQRKGRVITIFDVKLQLEYTGACTGEEDVTGSITVPEVAHDTAEDEYVFEIAVYDESKAKQPVKDLVRAKLLPQLRAQFQQLAPALIEEHGKDLQHPVNATEVGSGGSAKSTAIAPSKEKAALDTSAAVKGSSVNTTSVVDDSEYRTTAEELYQTFTDPARIAAFTREAPRVFEGAKAGGKFELFGGNVIGSYLELDQPTRIVQNWRLKQWPAGHFSKLSIRFDQNNADQVTNMRVKWDGIPVGQEEVTKRNWGEYYVKSIKTTFGFGTVL